MRSTKTADFGFILGSDINDYFIYGRYGKLCGAYEKRRSSHGIR